MMRMSAIDCAPALMDCGMFARCPAAQGLQDKYATMFISALCINLCGRCIAGLAQ